MPDISWMCVHISEWAVGILCVLHAQGRLRLTECVVHWNITCVRHFLGIPDISIVCYFLIGWSDPYIGCSNLPLGNSEGYNHNGQGPGRQVSEEGRVPQYPTSKLSLQAPNQRSSALSSPEINFQASTKMRLIGYWAVTDMLHRTGEKIWESAFWVNF